MLLLAMPSLLLAAEARVPVHLDYQLVHKLLVSQLFVGPQQQAEVVDDGCSTVWLQDPLLAAEDEALLIEARVEARLGMQALGACQQVLSWQGRVGVLGTPRVQSDERSVRFEPTRTWLEEPGGARLTSGPVWEVLDAGIRTYLQRFTLDFSPQIESLQRALPDFLPQRSAAQLQGIIDSLRLSSLQVTSAGLDAEISLQVDEIRGATVSADPLDPAELEAWESRWQMMDALLVAAVKQYASATDQPELRAALLDVLIDSRYRLRDALEVTPTRAKDPVRAWFLDSWQRLGPVIRDIAAGQPGQEWAQLLSVVTAADALEVLDQMGPGVGLDISSEGLRRLARMINGEQGEALLRYSEEIDPELIELWRQGEAADTAPPSSRRGKISLFPRAWAGRDEDRLNTWAPQRDELPDYLPLVQQVLERNAGRTLAAQSLNPEREQIFRKLVEATAWQESCWRQYVVEATKLVPLRLGHGRRRPDADQRARVARFLRYPETALGYRLQRGCRRPDTDGLPGPLRHQAGRGQPSRRPGQPGAGQLLCLQRRATPGVPLPSLRRARWAAPH